MRAHSQRGCQIDQIKVKLQKFNNTSHISKSDTVLHFFTRRHRAIAFTANKMFVSLFFEQLYQSGNPASPPHPSLPKQSSFLCLSPPSPWLHRSLHATLLHTQKPPAWPQTERAERTPQADRAERAGRRPGPPLRCHLGRPLYDRNSAANGFKT